MPADPTCGQYSPTEWLILEVLAARHRLGEHHWTFPRSFRPTLRRLEARDLIGWKDGIAEGTVRAWLSDSGVDAATSPTYQPTPLAEGTVTTPPHPDTAYVPRVTIRLDNHVELPKDTRVTVYATDPHTPNQGDTP